MKQKIIVASLITILLIGAVSTPINVLATNNSGNDDQKQNNDDNNYLFRHYINHDDHYIHDSCNHLPILMPFRDLWVFACSFQTQIDQINTKINALSTGGGTGGSSTTWCPSATNIDLSQGDFRLRSFQGCNLSNAQLNDAQFQYTNLIGANLTNANLGGTNLSYADLTNAKLQNTDFTGANLNGIITIGCHYGTTQPHGTPSVGFLPNCVP